jgi:hypothetical protein
MMCDDQVFHCHLGMTLVSKLATHWIIKITTLAPPCELMLVIVDDAQKTKSKRKMIQVGMYG